MPDATNPNAIDWNTLLQFLLQLAPLLASLKAKAAYAQAHGLADPMASFLTFVSDYEACRKAMGETS